MPDTVVVREYARLTSSHLAYATLDEAQISQTAFDWLCELSSGFRRSGATLMQLENQRWLRLDSFVGVLESPCGQVIEILPKHFDEGDCERQSRELLKKLIASSLELNCREAEEAGLELYDAPLAEWVMGQFLHQLERLLKRGLRFDYQRVEEEQRYLRGQLDVVRQMRQPPGRAHFFQIRHDVFLPDRPENRLLKRALLVVLDHAKESANWRLAHELAAMLHELPESRDIGADFGRWQHDRLMAHYESIKPWCELILYRHMPLAVHGDYRGISLLFPMEKLFELYVARMLPLQLMPDARLHTQAKTKYLCRQDGKDMFQLKPDLLIEQSKSVWVLDTKWKRVNSKSPDTKYDLRESDFYQMLAYARQYLPEGKGDMVLIYPKSQTFVEPLQPFDLYHKLTLHVWPFDLERDELIGTERSSLPLCKRNAPTQQKDVA
ncbi:McrC family protein [Shewanella algae]|uniref:McrC family protein n=1 Tax=Shewanella algae TaxID=38313 RepID=UPI000E32F414|nr:McrC family protein [Shewanella algae]AXQ15859.1 restriction endonuclease [Shewanella algae]QXP18786.1 McrC family protein [Shewanella algae]QXP28348.1 McrC family protein [Shewanella algae]QXP34642.1 McrC family protein [Shewanella algae]QXP37542.1 McrC family protein [Shewanella algae]